MSPAPTPTINELWHSTEPVVWDRALGRYWEFVQPRNLALERSLDALDRERLRGLDAGGWYCFLRDEYYPWKFTQGNACAANIGHLRRYLDEDRVSELDDIRRRLLSLDPCDIRAGLDTATEIRGLSVKAGSGLLALMYPEHFGTVDQFAVRALRGVDGLPEAAVVEAMNPDSLTPGNGVVLIEIMRRKAADLNRLFGVDTWTPRRVDQILWTYGR